MFVWQTFKKKLRRSGQKCNFIWWPHDAPQPPVLLLPYVVHLHHPHHPASLDTCPSSRDHQRLGIKKATCSRHHKDVKLPWMTKKCLPSTFPPFPGFSESFHQDQVLHINWFLYSIVCLYGPYGMKNPQKELFMLQEVECFHVSQLPRDLC